MATDRGTTSFEPFNPVLFRWTTREVGTSIGLSSVGSLTPPLA